MILRGQGAKAWNCEMVCDPQRLDTVCSKFFLLTCDFCYLFRYNLTCPKYTRIYSVFIRKGKKKKHLLWGYEYHLGRTQFEEFPVQEVCELLTKLILKSSKRTVLFAPGNTGERAHYAVVSFGC